MKLSYFRNSSYSLNETMKNLYNVLENEGFKVLGETELQDDAGKIIHFTNEDWLNSIVFEETDIFNLIPSAFALVNTDEGVKIGIGSASLLGGVSSNKTIHKLAKEYETTLKEVLHKSAGVEDLKPSKVKLFSTKTCPYCTMEKDWLEKNNIEYEVVYVDANQKEAQYMVEKTGQMGVPVTEIIYEDGENDYMVGFDAVKLSTILNVN